MQVRVIGLLCLLLLTSVAGVATATHGGLHVTSTTYEGDARVSTPSDHVFLWDSKPFNISTTIQTGNASGEYRVCAIATPVENGSSTHLDCKSVTLEPNATQSVSLSNVSAPNNASGKYDLEVAVNSSASGGKTLGNLTTKVTFMSTGGDLDKDGLTNLDETTNGTLLTEADTDNDTLSDGAEVKTHGTNPLKADTDGDGLSDSLELQLGMNPTRSAVPVYTALFLLTLGVLAALGYRRYAREQSAEADSTDLESTRSAPVLNGTSVDDPAVGSTGGAADDTEFVSDEDRILQILADNDGRLMQGRLVELTDWSKSKVSRRLTTLEEEGRVRKITLGRENMVVLPGREPDGVQSPFEEEQ